MPASTRPVVLALGAALAALAGFVVAVPASPAHAATGEWVVEASPTLDADVRYLMHKRVAGQPGNWHILAVNVRQDDDGVTGGLTSLRCPRGVRPTVAGWDGCTQVGGSDFVDELGFTVTWRPTLRRVRISGDVVLNDYWNDQIVQTTMDVRLLADGELTRTVTRQSFTEPDPWDYEQIDVERDGVTMRGYVGWLAATPTPVMSADPLHAYWAFSRGYGDGV